MDVICGSSGARGALRSVGELFDARAETTRGLIAGILVRL